MRLAIFTSHFPGRINTFFARDVRGLIDAGIEVEVFVTHPLDPELWRHVPDVLSAEVLPRERVHHSSFSGSVATALTWPRTWRHTPALVGMTASALGHGLTPFVKTAYVVPKAMAWARRHRSRFDHVLAYWGNYPATCAYAFHRAAGGAVPFSMFLHAGTDLYRSRVYLAQKLRYADNIVVVCDFNRQFLKSTYPAVFDQLAPKIYLHHLGVDVGAVQFSPSGREANRILAVGGLHPAKGFDDLLRAVAELRRRGRSLETVIVGGGPEAKALERLAHELGLGAAVQFTGWQSSEDVLVHMRRAALLVHPSIGLGDAVPTVIKEAMAVGTPVIGSAVAGIPELLDDGRCGVLTPPRNPRALADAIASLLDAPDRRQALAVAARARVEAHFNQTRNGVALADRLRRTERPVPVARRAGARMGSGPAWRKPGLTP
jgi:glycosyltransferase involved in cell wall biosynthesis